MKKIAIILAAGKGNRFGNTTPKQFLKIKNKMIVEYSLEEFQNHPEIDEITLICPKDYENFLIEYFKINTNTPKYPKLKQIFSGGKERHLSTLVALNFYKSNNEDYCLLFHDGARPLINKAIIDNCIEGFSKYKAFTTAVKTTDTIGLVKENKLEEITNRTFQWNIQTPQCFLHSVLFEAYCKALELQEKSPDDFIPTDDCTVVAKFLPQIPIGIIQGHPHNIKLTYQEDLSLVTYLIQSKSSSMS